MAAQAVFLSSGNGIFLRIDRCIVHVYLIFTFLSDVREARRGLVTSRSKLARLKIGNSAVFRTYNLFWFREPSYAHVRPISVTTVMFLLPVGVQHPKA